MIKRTISLTRDSVCIADDGYEHKREIFVPSEKSVKEIIRKVCDATQELPDKIFYKLFLISCLALFISSCAVPTVLIKGTVYDADGPLPYTCVYTRYPRNGVITDTAGRYSLSVPQKERAKVYFANIGYKEAVVEYSQDCDKDHFDVRMEKDSTVLFDRIQRK